MSHWSAEWSRYLAAFHTERPGVTEEVLNRALSGQHSPYKWLARAVAGRAELVLDIGCGSGAMTRELARDGRVVIGVDLSDSELQRARNSTTGSWVQADARQLPFADGSVDAVVSTLGLAVIHPLKNWLDEVHRVLKPGGVLAALTPTVRPVSASDIKVALNIGRELRQVPNFPVGIELASGPVLLERACAKLRTIGKDIAIWCAPARTPNC